MAESEKISRRELQGAAPLFWRGGPTGCLIIHGFMASPNEVGWLGTHLAEAGHTVYVPRLPGHGTDPSHMKRVRWQDWYAAVRDSWHLLRQQCERVVVIGHSMGGLLGLLLAEDETLDGLVMVAVPLQNPSALMPYTGILHWLMPYTTHPSEDWLLQMVREEQLRRGEEAIGRIHYARWATRAIYELHHMIEQGRAALPQISGPLLLLYAEQDQTAPISNMAYAAQAASKAQIEQVTLTEGAHVVFMDVGREEACRRIAAFVAGRG